MSIRRYLVLMLLSMITLVIFVSAIQGYKASMGKAQKVFDNELVSLAQIITAVELPKGVIKHKAASHFAYQIVLDDIVVTRSDNAPKKIISTLKSGFKEANFSGLRWRTYTEKITEKSAVNYWVIIAQPLTQRSDLAESIILSAVTPIILVMPLLALIISLAVRQGLKPLTFLTRALKNKKANDLSQLTISPTKELAPVTATLNELFLRLSLAFEREKQFASDAAHELRTPLSVLKINLHNLQQSFNDLILANSGNNSTSLQNLPFAELEQSVERMAHVVDQILTLNRTNPEQMFAENTALNLQALLQESISELYPDIASRGHNIELNSELLSISGNRFAIGILMKNLIANAAKYTPDNGKILVSCLQDANNIILRVEDSGPGIAPTEYSRVFDRFYRVGGDSHNSKVLGCGLGLAIVKHIVELHQADISLSTSKTLSGLCVEVRFFKNKHNDFENNNENRVLSPTPTEDY